MLTTPIRGNATTDLTDSEIARMFADGIRMLPHEYEVLSYLKSSEFVDLDGASTINITSTP